MDWLLLAFKFWNTSASLFGCFVNSLLIYLCLYKSPRTIRVYATLIINFAVTDLVACFSHILLEFRIIPIPRKPIVAYQFNGLCQLTGFWSCQIGLGIFLHCITHGLWSLLLSFSYRFYILTHSGLTRKHVIIMIFIVYIPSFFELISIPPVLLGNQETIELVHQALPSHNITGTLTTAFDIFGSFSALFAVGHIVVPIYPVYIIIFILRRKIVKNLMINARMLSKETRAVHTQMLKCLTYQACIPIFMLVAVSCYFLAQFGVVNNNGIELATISIYLLMPVLSSLTYLSFVRPYREFCKRIFSTKVQDITSVTTREIRFNSSAGIESSKVHISTIQC